MNPLSQPTGIEPPAKFTKFGNPPLLQQIIGAVNTGLGVYQTVRGSGGNTGGAGGGGSGAAQCRSTTVSCLDQLIGEYQAAYQAIVARGGTNAELIQLVQTTLAACNNPSIFTQNNDPYLVNTKSQLQAKLTELQQAGANAIATPTPITTGGSAGTVAAGVGGVSAITGVPTTLLPGIPNTYLLLGAAAVGVGIYLIKK